MSTMSPLQVLSVPATSVLIVDDDEINRDIYRDMLEQSGVYDIAEAGDGQSALRWLDAHRPAPDALLVDIYMPGMDGIEFLGQLGSRGYRGGVILLSGVNMEMLSLARDIARDSGLQLLAAHPKPLQKELLAQLLNLGARPQKQAI